ncbi:scarecrow-like protein 14 [Cornus florida]|uniref:scarecrow-like protein 14 n=1 Tax=Cornus florida TaxID=4283 RepID=UPI00289BEF81|nr:scarecrow-like protein 14 [Cornus florida]
MVGKYSSWQHCVDQNGCKLDGSLTDHRPLPQPPAISPCSVPEEEGDFSDACLKYISQMLMEEEDLEDIPRMFHDGLALKAAEKSFYDVLGDKFSSPNPHPDQNVENPNNNLGRICNGHTNLIDTNCVNDRGNFKSSHVGYASEYMLQSLGSSNSCRDSVDDGPTDSPFNQFPVSYSYSESQMVPRFTREESEVSHFLPNQTAENGRNHSQTVSKEKKSHCLEYGDYVEQSRSNKQFASNYAEESVQLEMFDNVLLCPGLHDESALCPIDEGMANRAAKKLHHKPKVGRPRKKIGNNKLSVVVDLRTLLTQCAQAVVSSDFISSNELLKRIRQHSSPYGDAGERLAYYMADALEARLAGTGPALYAAFNTRRIAAANALKAYQVYVSACPFLKMSYSFANRSIAKVAKNATRLHIIDFGISYGFQWPCLIQRLSVRPEGPPTLRITGIELPQQGFRPTQRVEETGRRLAKYCKRFNVPFEYNVIARKWETVRLEDLKIDRNEVVVVNCMYRFRNVADETLLANSPRDKVLNFIQRINPHIFIHGVLNGTYNAPFFVTRFKEALFHFSALFDMFEANAPRDDPNRMLFEKEVFGKDVMNLIACEGTERIERPETYRQWQVRNARAGFKQLPLNQEIVNDVRNKVNLGYHRDFVVDEDSNWMLQGWKGRVIYALSCWKPARE